MEMRVARKIHEERGQTLRERDEGVKKGGEVKTLELTEKKNWSGERKKGARRTERNRK